MALSEINFRSHTMGMTVSVNVILPEQASSAKLGGAPEGTYKTLYLLHGLGGNHSDWVRKTAIERYAADHGIAVVMQIFCRPLYLHPIFGKCDNRKPLCIRQHTMSSKNTGYRFANSTPIMCATSCV